MEFQIHEWLSPLNLFHIVTLKQPNSSIHQLLPLQRQLPSSRGISRSVRGLPWNLLPCLETLTREALRWYLIQLKPLIWLLLIL